MLAPRSAKALQEKVLLKLHGIRKLPGSPSSSRNFVFGSLRNFQSLRKLGFTTPSEYDCDHDSFGAFPSYEAKRRLEIRSRVERKLRFLRGVGRKELGGRID
ncbi:hypothetical protein Tco_0597560 [Tanacetum coccineum]